MLNDFKRQVVELLKSLETGDRSPLATINPNKYIQHDLRVADGLAGFRERLEALPKGAAKVNIVRVISVLKNKRIAGAAIDVFDIEPLPPSHPFRTLDNVLATPHIGYVSQGLYKTFFEDTV